MEAGTAKMGFLEMVGEGRAGFKNYLDTLISAPCIALTVLTFPA